MKKVSTILVISALLACQSFADATSDFCVQVKSTMNKGAKGVNVLYLQKKLVAEGLLTDKARTNFDTDTFNAVKSFQKKNGLAQVGNVGPGTLAKMRSLWCSTSPTSASKPTGSNSNVEVLQDYVVTFIGERMINIKTDKICNLPNGGSIDWGDGQVNVLGPRISEDYKCKTEGFFHELNSVDNNITVLDDTGKARYKINVKISKPVQDNVYIEDFTAQKFYSNKYQFKWSTGNAVKCTITDNKQFSKEVNVNGLTEIEVAKVGTVYELSCTDSIGRESKAWTVAGELKDAPNYAIKQFNPIFNGDKASLVWLSTDDVINCVLDGDPNTPKNGVAALVMGPNTFSIQLHCNTKRGYEYRNLFVNRVDITKNIKINKFTSEVIKDNVKLTWESNSTNGTCRLSGGIFSNFGKIVEKSGTFVSYFPTGTSTISLQCSDGGANGDFKSIEVYRP